MTKKIENQEEIVVAEAVSKTEKFFERMARRLLSQSLLSCSSLQVVTPTSIW